MRRAAAAFLTVFLVLATAVVTLGDQSDAGKDQGDFLSSLVGSYEVIGRFPESLKTYSGTVNISRKGNSLVLERKINGVKTSGEASIQSATADNIPVVRAAWKHEKTAYGATYLVHTDLDNYPRLTGYIYLPGRETKKPGIEALFVTARP